MKAGVRASFFLILAAFAGALGSLTGCTLGTEQAGPPSPLEMLQPVPAARTTAPPQAAGRAIYRLPIVQSNNAFAVALYQQLKNEQPGNLFFSPFTLSTSLGMTLLGARGQTAEQMTRALALEGIENPQAKSGGLLQGLNEIWQAENVLSDANGLWGPTGNNFGKPYLTLTQQFYGCVPRQVDFTAPASAAREINAWAATQTANRFKDLVQPGDLNDPARLALVNAVYFKGLWHNLFEKDAMHEAAFLVDGRTSVSARMMFLLDECNIYEDDDVAVLELPFKGESLAKVLTGQGLAMDVILPHAVDGLKTLDLGGGKLEGWLAGLQNMPVAVHLPQFEVKTRIRLDAALTALGMTDAFKAGAADFSGMSEGGKKDLALGFVLHQAWICVDGQGVEPAAAIGKELGLGGGTVTPPILFKADHPFLFLVRDRLSGAILFLGRVTEPKAPVG